MKKNYTIVSGLWNIGRNNRPFEEHYIERFKEFLQIDAPMFLFLPKYLNDTVWSIRESSNTFIKTFELEDVKNIYKPHWEQTQKIRTSKEWVEQTGEKGWLVNSPQATLEYYNPIVQSKVFLLHDASIYNTFNTEYFYWLDAGITNTVPASHLIQDKSLDRLIKATDPFIFLSYPYETKTEIHGFSKKEIDKISENDVKYVCRGGLFGGHKEVIKSLNGTYYSLLQNTLSKNLMGTEESLFTIISYKEPETYRRFMLDENGLIVKFTQALLEEKVELENIPISKRKKANIITEDRLKSTKTNSYILTFNFPEQLQLILESMKKTPEWLKNPKVFILDNSTKKNSVKKNKELAQKYGTEYIKLEGNTGICGGRQFAAEHFNESDADFMFFFEDDMTIISSEMETKFCRNGFRRFIPNLYNIVHKIMLKEKFDFLKLSFTEVYWDNNIQTSWYNVPQNIRTQIWPDYDQLPITGRDPNSPRTKFDRIDTLDNVSYITGEVFYCNWPMIVSKEGNKKMFIDTKWAHPYEQTWMSYMFQETIEGRLSPAVLLASPINHNRIAHYEPKERREN